MATTLTIRCSGMAAQTFVGRVRYDLYSESHVGAIFTDRELHGGHSRLAGFDSNFRLNDTHSVGFRAMRTAHRDLDGRESGGASAERRAAGCRDGTCATTSATTSCRRSSGPTWASSGAPTSAWSGSAASTFGTRRSWLQRWGPEWTYERNHDFAGVLQDEQAGGGLNFAFARNSFIATNYDRVLERYRGIDFYKKRFRVFARTDASRRIGLSLEYRRGDQIFFDPASPYLGYERGLSAFINLRPISRLKSEINIDTNRFTDPRNGGSGRVRGAHRARPHDVAVQQPPAGPQHQRIQHLRQDVRPQRAVHLPRQRRHGVLRRLRRPLPAGRPHRLELRPRRAGAAPSTTPPSAGARTAQYS